jgi:hypothetical protein
MLANQVTAHGAWEPAVGWEPLSFGGTRCCTISELFRLRRYAQALVGGARGPEAESLALIPSRSLAVAGEWPRLQETSQWQSSPSLAQGLESVWPSIVTCSGGPSVLTRA